MRIQYDEKQNIEFKESWRDEYLKWLCGFANAQGGRIKNANPRRCSWWSFGNHRQRNLIDR